MPASEIMSDFRAHKLHSGKSGKIVTNPHQAKAILLSYLRKEGHNIPKKSKKNKNLVSLSSLKRVR
jgi:Family of unknown function (DUF6496)